ncbi:MAG: hypothetical protein WD267_09085 [Balneolales bacterium]
MSYTRVIHTNSSLLGCLFIIYITFIHVFDAEFIEAQINKKLQKVSNGHNYVQIENINFSLREWSLQAKNVKLVLHRPNYQQQHNGMNLPSVRYEFDMAGFTLDGINLLEFIRNDKIKMNSLVIENPEIGLMMEKNVQPSNNGQEQKDDISLHASLAQQLPDIDIQNLQFINAALAVSFSMLENGEPAEHEIKGINLAFDNIKVDSISVSDHSRVLFSDDVRLSIDEYEGYSEKGVYYYEFGPITASTKEGTFNIRDISATPTISDEEFVEYMEVRTSRMIFDADSISIRDIDYRRLLDYQDIIIGHVTVDDFLYDAFTDINLPRITPTQLPHEMVRELEMYLNIREINLNSGQIIYAERAEDGARPGTITLDDTSVQIYNLTNDIEFTTTDKPTRITVNTKVYGEGELNTDIELALLAPDNPIYFSGKLGQINAQAFNDILIDLEGVNIISGVIDSLMFDIQSLDDHATGTVRSAYRNLEIETLDKVDYARDLGEQITTFVADDLLLRSSDEDNESSLREGEVDNEMDRMNDSLLNYLVDSILDGLLSTLVPVI